jgi:transposase-like protein
VDFRLSGRRDVGAAKAFFRNAIKHQGSAPRTITLDGYAASHRAVREMKTIVIAGIELLRRIHKGQFSLGGLRLKDRSTPAVWNAVLAA